MQVKKQRSQAIAIFLGRPVINLQPSFSGADRGRSRSYPGAVPVSGAAMRQATVVAPVHKIGRLGQPNVVPAQLRAAGPMEQIILIADSLFKDRAVLVMRRKDHDLLLKSLPITRSPQTHTNPVVGDLGIRCL